MKSISALILTLCLFCSNILADDKVTNACLQKPDKYICKYPKEKFGYTPSFVSRNLNRHLWDAVRLVNDGIRMIEKYNTITFVDGCGFGVDVGEILLNNLKKNASTFAKKHKLSQCQKACLALCISSNYIDYEGDNTASSINKIAATGKGICGNFSSFAVDLMKSFNLKASTTYAMYDDKGNHSPHSWVQIDMNGKRYFAKPQLDSCRFYEAK